MTIALGGSLLPYSAGHAFLFGSRDPPAKKYCGSFDPGSPVCRFWADGLSFNQGVLMGAGRAWVLFPIHEFFHGAPPGR